jgi:hypothetical protein
VNPPEVECPACECVFHEDDLHVPECVGHITECPDCGVKLECSEVEFTATWHWDALPIGPRRES